MMELVFLRLHLEKFKNTNNIFKKIYFYFRIFLIKIKLSFVILTEYNMYDLIIQYIELYNILKKIYPHIELLTFNNSINDNTIVFNDNQNAFVITPSIFNKSRNLSVKYVYNYYDSSNNTTVHFDIPDYKVEYKFNDYSSLTDIDKLRKHIEMRTRLDILASVINIINSI